MAEYIEREAAIDAVLKLTPKVDDDGYCWVIRGDAARAIDSIPAADVRPAVRSKWIKMKFFPDWECEKCGSVVSGNTPDPWNHYHFCPNCGAKMREGS